MAGSTPEAMSEYSFENPSPRFTLLGELYRQVHEAGLEDGADASRVFGGGSLLDHIETVGRLANHTHAKSILDYGSGKGLLYKAEHLELRRGKVIRSVQEYWNVDDIHLYDPGVEEYAARPTGGYDGVISTDVLEHIPEEDIDWVLAECFSMASGFLYMNIASYPAKKILPNGWNAHVTIQPPAWWQEKIGKAAQGWGGQAYVFDITEKRNRLLGSILRRLGGSRFKLTRIESWG